MLRCEAELLVTRLWQVRVARFAREQYVGALRRTVFTWMVVIMALIFFFEYAFFTPLYLVILCSGMMGALISILRRLQAANDAVSINLDQSSDLSALANEKLAIVVSLLAGGVFAILLYVLFVAGLWDLSEKLAPTFVGHTNASAHGGVDFMIFLNDIGPKTGVDYAKIVVWSFAAGFFEQLVPDVLNRLVKQEPKK